MRLKISILLVAALVTFAIPGPAKSSHAGSHSRSGFKVRSTRRTRCANCARDSRGRIKRGRAAKRAFQRSHPCPATGRPSGPCPGYVIDHVRALKRGGADASSNMQWQTRAQAKAKDRVE